MNKHTRNAGLVAADCRKTSLIIFWTTVSNLAASTARTGTNCAVVAIDNQMKQFIRPDGIVLRLQITKLLLRNCRRSSLIQVVIVWVFQIYFDVRQYLFCSQYKSIAPLMFDTEWAPRGHLSPHLQVEGRAFVKFDRLCLFLTRTRTPSFCTRCRRPGKISKLV